MASINININITITVCVCACVHVLCVQFYRSTTVCNNNNNNFVLECTQVDFMDYKTANRIALMCVNIHSQHRTECAHAAIHYIDGDLSICQHGSRHILILRDLCTNRWRAPNSEPNTCAG